MVIKPEISKIIKLDGQDSLILNATSLNGLTSIIIHAKKWVSNKELTPMKIIAYLPSTGEQVGMMEYYCAERVNKSVKLIYVQFSNEKNHPIHITPLTLETFLNDQSMNQLFMKFMIDTVHLTSKYTSTQIQKWTNKEIIDSLNIEYFGDNDPLEYRSNRKSDYYYITNLVKSAGSGKKVGAFHWTGETGGVHMALINGTTSEESATHEFGHWLAMPHTWKKFRNIGIIVPFEGGTRDNFMDY